MRLKVLVAAIISLMTIFGLITSRYFSEPKVLYSYTTTCSIDSASTWLREGTNDFVLDLKLSDTKTFLPTDKCGEVTLLWQPNLEKYLGPAMEYYMQFDLVESYTVYRLKVLKLRTWDGRISLVESLQRADG